MCFLNLEITFLTLKATLKKQRETFVNLYRIYGNIGGKNESTSNHTSI